MIAIAYLVAIAEVDYLVMASAGLAYMASNFAARVDVLAINNLVVAL